MPPLPSTDENAAPLRPSWQELKARVADLAARSPSNIANQRALASLPTNAAAAQPFAVVIQKDVGRAPPTQRSLLANPPVGLPTPPPSFESPRQRAPQRPRQGSPSPRKAGSSDTLSAGPAPITSTPVKGTAATLSAAKRTREMRSPANTKADAMDKQSSAQFFSSPNPRLRKNVRAEETSQVASPRRSASPSKSAAWTRAHDLEDWRAVEGRTEEGEEGEELEESESEEEDMETSEVIPVVVVAGSSGTRQASASPSKKSPRKKVAEADPDASFVMEAREKGWDLALPPSPVKTVYIVAPPLPFRRRESTLPRDEEGSVPPPSRRGRISTQTPSAAPRPSLPFLITTKSGGGRKSVSHGTPLSSLMISRQSRRSTSALTPPRSLPRLSATPVEPESPTDDPLLLYGPPKLEGLEEETMGDDTFADMRVKKESGVQVGSDGEEEGEDDGDEEEEEEEDDELLQATYDARSDTEEPQSFLDSIGGTIEESGHSLGAESESDGEEEGQGQGRDHEEDGQEEPTYDPDDGEGAFGDFSNGAIDEEEEGEHEDGEGEKLEDGRDEDGMPAEEAEPLSFEEQARLLRQELTQMSQNDGEEEEQGEEDVSGKAGDARDALQEEESEHEEAASSASLSEEDSEDEGGEPEYVGRAFNPIVDASGQTVEDEDEEDEHDDHQTSHLQDGDEPSQPFSEDEPAPQNVTDDGLDAQSDLEDQDGSESESEVEASISPAASEVVSTSADVSMAQASRSDGIDDDTEEQEEEARESAETPSFAQPSAEELLEESIVDAALAADEGSQSLASDSDESDNEEDPAGAVVAVGGTRSPTPLLPATPAAQLPADDEAPAPRRPTHPLVAALRGDSSRSRSRTGTSSIHRFAIQADGSLEASGVDDADDTSALDDLSASMDSASRRRAMMLSRKSRRPIIEISSLDGEAAARAAACLVLNHDYIRNGTLRGADGGEDVAGDVSLQPGADLTLPELLMEKEIELVGNARKGKGPLARPVPSTPRTLTAATPNGKASFKIALPSTPSSPFIPGAFPKSAKKVRRETQREGRSEEGPAETLHDKLVRKALAKTGHQEASLDHFRISSWVSLEEVVGAAIVHEARIAHRQMGMSSAEAQKRAALNVDRSACLDAFYEAHRVRLNMRGETSQWSDLRMQHRCASLQRRYLRLLEQRHPGTLQGDEKAVLDDTRDASAWHRLEKRYQGWEGYGKVGTMGATAEVSFGTPFRRGTHSTPARGSAEEAGESLYPTLVETPERPAATRGGRLLDSIGRLIGSPRTAVAPAPVAPVVAPVAPIAPRATAAPGAPADTSCDTSTSFSSRSFADDVKEAAARLEASRKKKRSQLHEDVIDRQRERVLPPRAAPPPSSPTVKALAARKRDELRQSWAQREATSTSADRTTVEPAKKSAPVRTSGLGPRTSGGSSSVQPTALLFLPDSAHAEARRKALQLAQSRQNRLWKSPPSLRHAQKLAASRPNSFGSLTAAAADATASRSFWKAQESRDENADMSF